MGKVTTYTYNALGKVESVTDPLNHRTEFTYNSRGQNTEVRDAANNVSSATYDLLGNVTRLAGPLGGATNYTYDDMGRLISESTTSGGTKSYEYNELNVRKKITNARGQIRQVFYDSMGRITGFTSPEGAVSYTYDANGNVLTVTDSHGTITRTYDALNRVLSYTDTYGKVIRYEYDAVGNLSKIIYPDNTAVTYAYDANHNLVRVTDWANRVTTYTYDVNNRVVGVTKPDGSVTTTVYDSKQRVTSTVERTAAGAVITGFEYTYDDLSRIIEEKVLANSTKICYTYDNLNRVTKRTIKNLSNVVLSEEAFTYDAAGNVTDAPESCFQYDTNNRLIVFNGNTVSYDMDGNMLNNGVKSFTYDSANQLLTADGHTYTYNAEGVRIRNLCTENDTTYTYDTNCKLSRLLTKSTGSIVTKYVYGRGLIGEETSTAFKTYHFDSRGSTIAITDASGNITDTFAYDTYGKLISRTGTSKVIFGYNGRDGVITDTNGLIYMRARYYLPEMKRFVNADIIPGKLNNAVTLNRYAYANANPAINIDPTGLWSKPKWLKNMEQTFNTYFVAPVKKHVVDPLVEYVVEPFVEHVVQPIIETGQKAVDYIATDLGEDIVEVITTPINKNNSTHSTNPNNKETKNNNILKKISEIPQRVKEAVTVDIGVGAGMGFEGDVGDATIGAIVREDFITFKKDAGETDIKVGKSSEMYTGIQAFGGFVGQGKERFTDLDASTYAPENTIEPKFDFNNGVGIKAYYGVGFTFSIGFDVDYFLDSLIFS